VELLSNPQCWQINNSRSHLSQRIRILKTSSAHSRIIRNEGQVKSRIHNSIENEEGMTTAEYAVGTVAAAGLGGLLLKMLTSPEVQELLWSIVQQAFSFLFAS
jgi:hypothetical protein